jgi:hypothetical protein
MDLLPHSRVVSRAQVAVAALFEHFESAVFTVQPPPLTIAGSAAAAGEEPAAGVRTEGAAGAMGTEDRQQIVARLRERANNAVDRGMAAVEVSWLRGRYTILV